VKELQIGSKSRYRANWTNQMRRPCTFRKTEVTRGVKAVLAAGINIDRVEIDSVTGKISIMTGSSSNAEKITDLDKWMGDHARQT
jgi:hypothetical protein